MGEEMTHDSLELIIIKVGDEYIAYTGYKASLPTFVYLCVCVCVLVI